MITKQSEWIARCKIEMRYAHNAYFSTATYSDDHLPLTEVCNEHGEMIGVHGTLIKKHYHDFNLLVRYHDNQNRKKYPQFGYNGEPLPRMKYKGIAEYGERTLRPHYHHLYWNLHDKTAQMLHRQQIWKKGNLKIGPLKSGGIEYVTKHQIKAARMNDRIHKTLVQPFRTQSTKPPIGEQYLESGMAYDLFEKREFSYFPIQGQKHSVPKRWKTKLRENDSYHKQALRQAKAEISQQEIEEKWNAAHSWTWEENHANRIRSMENWEKFVNGRQHF